MASLSELSLVLSDVSIMREPTLTISPPSSDGSTRDVERHVLAERRLQRRLQLGDVLVRQRLGAGDFGRDLAAMLGGKPRNALIMPGTANSRRLPRGDLEEIADEAADAGLVGDGADGARLVLGGEHRAAHEALQVGALVDEGGEAIDVLFDGGQRSGLVGEFEQRVGIALGDTRYLRVLSATLTP